MSDAADNTSTIMRYWPAIVLALGLGASVVRADSKIDDNRERVDYLYRSGSPAVVDRLARIEERQIVTVRAIERIESKLDLQQERERAGGQVRR